MKSILLIVVGLTYATYCAAQSQPQLNDYTFQFEEIHTRAEAKGAFDVIRHYFNTPEEPYKHVLRYDEATSLFTISSTFDVSEEEFKKYFLKKGLNTLTFVKQ